MLALTLPYLLADGASLRVMERMKLNKQQVSHIVQSACHRAGGKVATILSTVLPLKNLTSNCADADVRCLRTSCRVLMLLLHGALQKSIAEASQYRLPRLRFISFSLRCNQWCTAMLAPTHLDQGAVVSTKPAHLCIAGAAMQQDSRDTEAPAPETTPMDLDSAPVPFQSDSMDASQSGIPTSRDAVAGQTGAALTQDLEMLGTVQIPSISKYNPQVMGRPLVK